MLNHYFYLFENIKIMTKTGTLVPLAWPETPAVIEGKWYDTPMKWIGIVKDNKWPVGHAAMLLIDHSNGEVHYMDFGRYHSPIKQGRVRDKYTDPDIEVQTKAIIKNKQVINLEELLHELSLNKVYGAMAYPENKSFLINNMCMGFEVEGLNHARRWVNNMPLMNINYFITKSIFEEKKIINTKIDYLLSKKNRSFNEEKLFKIISYLQIK